MVDGRIDKVVENGDVDSSDDETFSGLTCLVQWLSHASEIIVESPTMDLEEENEQRLALQRKRRKKKEEGRKTKSVCLLLLY